MPGILVVEDDNDLRVMLRDTLIRRKYTVLEAQNGKDAIMHFKPAVTDLLVTDLIMPEEDGLKVIMKLKEVKPSLKVIAISGGRKAGPGSYLNLAKLLGADAVLSKPFSLNDLLQKIDELLELEQS